MLQQTQKVNKMFNKKIVLKALQQTWALEGNPGCNTNKTVDDQSSATSRLIYDIFGGEILKTQYKESWHFYNLIDGERIDFSLSEINKSLLEKQLEDHLSTPEETHHYFSQEDYLTFYMRFISAFEEIVGLKRYSRRMAV